MNDPYDVFHLLTFMIGILFAIFLHQKVTRIVLEYNFILN